MTKVKEITKEEVEAFLNSCGSVKNDLKTVITGLRRKQIIGSQQCTKATVEIIRALLVQGKFNSTDQAMRLVRAVGKQLIEAAQTELTIGNLVRRILFFIREEYASLQKEHEVVPEPTTRSRTSSRDVTSSKSAKSHGIVGKDRSDSNLSTGSNSSYVAPLPVVVKTVPAPVPLNRNSSSSGNLIDQTPTLETMLSQLDLGSEAAEDFSKPFIAGLKAAVLAAINELVNELDNTGAVCQRAKEYISADETILTYGYSRLVELFLKAAGAKRQFKLIIAEAEPGLEGHKLAAALSKVPNIKVTLIPDTNIYALMSRVNKVIFAPQAVLADGGSICTIGHLMVAIVAKEFAVPVVGVSGAFTFTPLFEHNMLDVLNLLASPNNVIPFDIDIDMTNVLVVSKMFDFVPPHLINTYVTNDGSSLPSYVYRQLSEYYHPKDYAL